MKKRKNPRDEKEKDYEKQHFSPGKYDKAFRKQWPRKKAVTERVFRRSAQQILNRADAEGQEDLDVELSRKRESIRKWEVLTLRELIKKKQAKRRATIGARKRRQSES